MLSICVQGLEKAELHEIAERLGEKPFRGTQVFEWVHKKRAIDFEQMSNIGVATRALFESEFNLESLELAEKQTARDGSQKYVFRCSDGQAIESVLIPHNYGYSVCVSTQAGCRMACVFCASATGGLARDLSAAEIVGQVLYVQRGLDDCGQRVSRVDFMGCGEPLDNYDNVVKSIRIMTDPSGLAIGARKITLSTCGLAPEIRRLAREGLQVTLSVSLHAPDDATRTTIMPVNKRYPLKQVLEACGEYSRMTGRRVTYEYALIDGLNDSVNCARDLSRLLRGKMAHVNLIPLNPVSGRTYVRSDAQSVMAFCRELERHGVPASIRREMGSEIAAACGQLRRRELDADGRRLEKRAGKRDK